MDSKVNDYFSKLPKNKRKLCLTLRGIILKNFPEIQEEYRWGAVVYDNGRFYLAGVRRGVNIGFAIHGLSKEEISLFKGSGKTMRHLKFESVKEIDETMLSDLLQLVKKKSILSIM